VQGRDLNIGGVEGRSWWATPAWLNSFLYKNFINFSKEDMEQHALSFLAEKYPNCALDGYIRGTGDKKAEFFTVVGFVNAIAAFHEVSNGMKSLPPYRYCRILYKKLEDEPTFFIRGIETLRKMNLEGEVIKLISQLPLPPSDESVRISMLGTVIKRGLKNEELSQGASNIEELFTQGLRSLQGKADEILTSGLKQDNYEFGLEQCICAFIGGFVQGGNQGDHKKILNELVKSIIGITSAELLPAGLRALLAKDTNREEVLTSSQKLLKALDHKNKLIKALISGDRARILAASDEIIDVVITLLQNDAIGDAQKLIDSGVVDDLIKAFVTIANRNAMHAMIEQGKQVLGVLAQNPSAVNVIPGLLNKHKALLLDIVNNRQGLVTALKSGDRARILAASDEIIDVVITLLQNDAIGDAQKLIDSGVINALIDEFVTSANRKATHAMIGQGKQVLSVLAKNPSVVKVIPDLLNKHKALLLDIVNNRQGLVTALKSGDRARILAASDEIIDVVITLLQNDAIGDAQKLIDSGVVDDLIKAFVPSANRNAMHAMIGQGKQLLTLVAENPKAVNHALDFVTSNQVKLNELVKNVEVYIQVSGESGGWVQDLTLNILKLVCDIAACDNRYVEEDADNNKVNGGFVPRDMRPAVMESGVDLNGVEEDSLFFINELIRLITKRGVNILTSQAVKDKYKAKDIEIVSRIVLEKLPFNTKQEKESVVKLVDLILGATGRISRSNGVDNLRSNLLKTCDSIFNIIGLCSPVVTDLEQPDAVTYPNYKEGYLVGEVFNSLSDVITTLKQLKEDEGFKNGFSLNENDISAIENVLGNKKVMGRAINHTKDMVGMVKFFNFLLEQQKKNDSLNFIVLFDDIGSLLLGEGAVKVNAADLAKRIVEHIRCVTEAEEGVDQATRNAFNSTMCYLSYFMHSLLVVNSSQSIEQFITAEHSILSVILQDPGEYIQGFLAKHTNGIIKFDKQGAEDIFKDPAIWQFVLEYMQPDTSISGKRMEKSKVGTSAFKAFIGSKIVRHILLAPSSETVRALSPIAKSLFVVLIISLMLPHLMPFLASASIVAELVAVNIYISYITAAVIGVIACVYSVAKIQEFYQLYTTFKDKEEVINSQLLQWQGKSVVNPEKLVSEQANQVGDSADCQRVLSAVERPPAGGKYAAIPLCEGPSGLPKTMSSVAAVAIGEGAVEQSACKTGMDSATLGTGGPGVVIDRQI
jgi:hypothetical protein